MKFKRIILLSAATAVFMGMTLNVSAAQSSADKYVKRLKKSGQVNLILDVEAYRAAYSDLEKAFGDDEDAYIKHYLTAGVYEGRTKGVLFDPLAYAESYDDIRDAFGDDVLAIINHYVTYGVKENRTAGTLAGYADTAAVMEVNTVQRVVQGGNNPAVSEGQAVQESSGDQAISGSPESQTEDTSAGDSSTDASSTGTEADTVQSTAQEENSPVMSEGQAVQEPSGDPTPSGAPESQTEDTSAGDSSKDFSYWRTTSIYANDNVTLLRVEYYDENNNLIFYSVVTDYDSDTKSYKEDIYSRDMEFVRTDTCVNGVKK